MTLNNIFYNILIVIDSEDKYQLKHYLQFTLVKTHHSDKTLYSNTSRNNCSNISANNQIRVLIIFNDTAFVPVW